ncbi:MAG: WhiB family transcriptional regulator [Ilumatobacteraceae bacterium]
MNVTTTGYLEMPSTAQDEWRDDALCRNTDPELFFPIGTTGHAIVAIEEAKRLCTECNVINECLDFALDTNQDSGVWGGHSEEERRAIRRVRAAEARAARLSS